MVRRAGDILTAGGCTEDGDMTSSHLVPGGAEAPPSGGKSTAGKAPIASSGEAAAARGGPGVVVGKVEAAAGGASWALPGAGLLVASQAEATGTASARPGPDDAGVGADFYQAAVANAGIPVVALDAAGSILTWNS